MIASAAGMLIAGCAVAMLVQPTVGATLGPLGVMVGMLVTGGLLLNVSRAHHADEQRAWRFVGAGLLAGGTGVLAVGISESLGFAPPAFGPLDLFFLSGYLLIILGLGLLPHVTGNWRHRTRVFLDGLVGAVSVGALLWGLILSDLWMATDGSPVFDRVFGSLYLVFDALILIALMLVTVRRGNFRFDLRLLFFGAGYTALTFGDVSFLVSGAGKSFGEATPNFFWYLVAAGLFLATGALVDRIPRPREYEDHKAPWWAMASPYGVATAMVGFLTVDVWQAELSSTDRTLFAATLLVAFLVIVRQALAIQENRVLVEEERSSLVSSISHELRTPLTSMIGFLELLESDHDSLAPAERDEFSEIVRDQAHYMGRIVMDLVMLSRDDHSRISLREEVVKADSVARNALNNLGSAAEKVVVDVDDNVFVQIDSARVVQIIANLLTNAIRYGKDKSLLVVARQNSDLLIEVHDNGPGVPKRHQAVVWDRFERGAHRFSSSVRGSGIGLAIVAAIAAAHKGSYGYRSSERLGGACFWVILPSRVVAEPTPVTEDGYAQVLEEKTIELRLAAQEPDPSNA